jgi:hypothetical protein
MEEFTYDRVLAGLADLLIGVLVVSGIVGGCFFFGVFCGLLR